MNTDFFPLIDVEATGKNIERLRKLRNLSVKDIQNYFGFEEPQAIYKWQWGKTLPSVDNLFALSYLLDVPVGDILVAKERVAVFCGSDHFCILKNIVFLYYQVIKPVVQLCFQEKWQNFS